MASMAPHLAEVANLVGDLARANILWADSRTHRLKGLSDKWQLYAIRQA
jgi:hypothetical protein